MPVHRHAGLLFDVTARVCSHPQMDSLYASVLLCSILIHSALCCATSIDASASILIVLVGEVAHGSIRPSVLSACV